MATYMVTGAAGMIGSKVAEQLLRRGDKVAGVDDLCASYDVRLKQWRLSQLTSLRGFAFHQVDVSEMAPLQALFEKA